MEGTIVVRQVVGSGEKVVVRPERVVANVEELSRTYKITLHDPVNGSCLEIVIEADTAEVVSCTRQGSLAGENGGGR